MADRGEGTRSGPGLDERTIVIPYRKMLALFLTGKIVIGEFVFVLFSVCLFVCLFACLFFCNAICTISTIGVVNTKGPLAIKIEEIPLHCCRSITGGIILF